LPAHRGPQHGVEDRAPAGDDRQICIAGFARRTTQEAGLVHLRRARPVQGAVHVGEPVPEDDAAQPEEVVRLAELGDPRRLPPLEHLIRGPSLEGRLRTAINQHDLVSTPAKRQGSGRPRDAGANHDHPHRVSMPQIPAAH